MLRVAEDLEHLRMGAVRRYTIAINNSANEYSANMYTYEYVHHTYIYILTLYRILTNIDRYPF